MIKKILILLISVAVIIGVPGCSQQSQQPVLLKSFPIDDLGGIISHSGIVFDKEISSDGNGSLRIAVTESTLVRLFETGNIDIEKARLFYQAKVRTENVEGRAYLEMLCHFPGQGEFFSRGFQSALSSSNDWSTAETSFFLKKSENPDNVKLNLVVSGKGTAWIDDIKLLKGPLK
jgi:hypothetical protein